MSERVPSPEKVSEPQDVAALNSFALRIYRQLLTSVRRNDNIVFSPTTLLKSLQQIYLASDGKSQEQLEKLLQISPEALSKLFQDLEHILQAGCATTKDRTHNFFTVTKILASPGATVDAKYRSDLKSLPGDHHVELVEQVQGDSQAVNGFVNQLASDVTQGRIENLKPDDKPINVDKHGLLFLSVASFRSDWENQFLKRTSVNYEGRSRQTIQSLPATLEDFHNADGSTAKVVMVHLQAKIFFTRDDDLKVTVLELPMTKHTNHLLIVLPDDTSKNALKEFESKFDENFFEILRKHWQMPLTHVYLPKFSVENHFSLEKSLEQLGVKDIFRQGKANLSHANVAGDLHVADVAHAASIDISCESGEGLPPYKPRPGECTILKPDTFATGFHVDRPFFFAVRPRHPQMWSLMGHVVNLMPEFETSTWHHHKHQEDQETMAIPKC